MSIQPARLFLFTAVAAVALGHAGVARAYVDLAPTLGKVVADSKSIALVEVSAFDSATQTVTLKAVRTLKGPAVTEPIVNRVAPDGGLASPTVRQWAGAGSRGVWFATKTTAIVCIGTSWYQAKRSGDAWKLGVDRPDLALAYCGATSRLADSVEKMLAGKSAVLTVVVYGATDVDTSFDLALGRTNLPGLVRVQRVRGSLTMAPMVAAASSQDGYVVGPGPVDAADLPSLRKGLKAADAATRAEAADSIGYLGKAARDAAVDLTAMLGDPDVSVRTSAAAALLRVTPRDEASKVTIGRELVSPDAAARRAAVSAAALAGGPAASLAGGIVKLLSDSDDAVRSAAMAAVTTLGPSIEPADAKAAVAALTPMLDDVNWRVETADALGRLGEAARPVPAALSKMLTDSQPAVQWAAVRSMAQIGGPEAKPAVEFIKEKLPGAAEVDQYNMMIYLALLGPVASDAAPVVRANRIKNPVLPSATIWAIGDTTRLPWTLNERRGGPGGFGPGGGGPGGGGPDGGGGPADINRYMYAAYIRELGDRLKPAADSFAKKLLDGTAGDVPEWGYSLLNADAAGSIATLTAGLSSVDRQVRQRAAVALGYMGSAATTAKPQVEAAAAKAADDKEKRLLTWTARKLTAVD